MYQPNFNKYFNKNSEKILKISPSFTYKRQIRTNVIFQIFWKILSFFSLSSLSLYIYTLNMEPECDSDSHLASLFFLLCIKCSVNIPTWIYQTSFCWNILRLMFTWTIQPHRSNLKKIFLLKSKIFSTNYGSIFSKKFKLPNWFKIRHLVDLIFKMIFSYLFILITYVSFNKFLLSHFIL